MRIAHNLCVDHFRKVKEHPPSKPTMTGTFWSH
jgi:DNA-directed RNA polymerase specialized sigma24 family protein